MGMAMVAWPFKFINISGTAKVTGFKYYTGWPCDIITGMTNCLLSRCSRGHVTLLNFEK